MSAATGKLEALRAQKQAIRNEIEAIHREIFAATERVPEAVINGSHQDAVAWKKCAKAVLYGRAKGLNAMGCRKATVEQLTELLNAKREILAAVVSGRMPEDWRAAA